MANFSNFTGVELPRFASICQSDDATRLPLGLAQVARNVRYTAESFGTRYGLAKAFSTGNAKAIRGMAMLKYSGATKIPFVIDTDGKMWKENPAGSGTMALVGQLNPDTDFQICLAYDNAYIAQSNLIEGTAEPKVFSGARQDLAKMSDLPLGVSWQANHAYVVGDIISPTTQNGLIYRCEVAGTSSGSEPTWPTGDFSTVADNGITWRESMPFIGTTVPAPPTPNFTHLGGGSGALAAGRDVYIKVTWVTGVGETDLTTQLPAVLVNTAANDGLNLSRPVEPGWNSSLSAPQKITNWRIYTADVATGGAAPADSAYKLLDTLPLSTLNYGVGALGAGAAGQTGNNAWLAGPGNICAGRRWMIVLSENLNGYIDGVSDAIPVSMDPVDAGRSMWVGRIPIGRANTKRRICAFTVAGDSKAGRYYYVPEDDSIPAGDPNNSSSVAVAITKTVIEDNVTTSAIFSFPDGAYLTGCVEVTDHFNKVEIPPCSDIFFSKTTNRLILTGVQGFPSGHLVSDEADPETFVLSAAADASGSELEVAEKDGYRTVCAREFGEQLYSLKEKGGYRIQPSGPRPIKWPAVEAWTGSGPCGPRAVDVSNEFLFFWDTAGPYLFTGNKPQALLSELTPTWKRLNRAAKQTVAVKIDEEAKEIHALLPLDGATKPNYRVRIKVKAWSELTSALTGLSRSGQPIAITDAPRVSIDPMDVGLILPMERTEERQVLYASNADDGLVRYEKAAYYSDEDVNGTKAGIDWQYDTVTTAVKLAQLALGGATIGATGVGTLNLTAICSGNKPAFPLTSDTRICDLGDGVQESYFDVVAKGAGLREEWGLSFKGSGEPDQWAEVHHATFYIQPRFGARRG